MAPASGAAAEPWVPAVASSSAKSAAVTTPGLGPPLGIWPSQRPKATAAAWPARGTAPAPAAPLPLAGAAAAAVAGGAAARRRGRRRAGACHRKGGRGRGRVALGEGLGTVQVVLAEGLGPGAAERYGHRRAEEQRVLQQLRELSHHRAQLAELRSRAGAEAEGAGPGAESEEEEEKVRRCQAMLRMRWVFLCRLDRLADMEINPEVAGSGDVFATGGAVNGLTQKLQQLRGPAVEVSEEFWNGLLGPDDSVFLEHGFLSSLEESGDTGLHRGWQPRFLLARGGGRLLGAVPLYLKDNSNGEFCEEMDWIIASHRFGVPPSPKLFVGIPFTPHRGRRLLAAAWLGPGERAAVEQALVRALRLLSERTQLGVNIAFSAAEEGKLFEAAGFVQRLARQAWWTNREPEPYEDFDDFLAALKPKKARAILRQRQELAAVEGLEIEVVDGALDPSAVTVELMTEVFRRCYASTQVRHGNAEQVSPKEIRFDLSADFFRLLAKRLPHRVLLVLARHRGNDPSGPGEIVGGALCFSKGRRICGRYWGQPLGVERVDFLHFECCYHKLVEHAIAHGYASVEPGNGGGSIYRVQRDRGFDPVLTPSYHCVPQPELREELGRLAEQAAAEGPPSWTAARHSAYAPARRSPAPSRPPAQAGKEVAK